MKLNEANISGPFRAESAIELTDPPRIEFEAAKTDGSEVSHVFSGFILQGYTHLSHKDHFVLLSNEQISQLGSSQSYTTI